MSKANTNHKDYIASQSRWSLLNDVCSAGDDAIKKGRTKYLPMPCPTDSSPENTTRYQQYLDRAVFYGATGKTLRGLVGMAFKKYPTLTLPDPLDYLAHDADGAGVSIYQQSQKVLSQALKIGRHGLFVDYPKTNNSVSLADKIKLFIRARIVSVNAEQIINWRTSVIGGAVKLTMIVIAENEEIADGFETKYSTRYRVLSLDDGVYNVRIYDSEGDKIIEQYQPTDGNNKPWNEIPFAFVGAQNNDSAIDEPPMLDMSILNLAHYRNSADYEDSVFYVGQAQPYITGLTEDWRDHLESQKIYAGSRSVMLLPVGGAYGYAQPSPNTLVKEAMDGKEKQMVALGARLIEKGSANKTATQVSSEDTASHSVLSLCANNVSDAYRLALKWCAQYENITGETDYAITQEYDVNTLDFQALTALVNAWTQGAIPQSQLFNNLRESGVVDSEMTDEELIEELDSEGNEIELDEQTAKAR